MEGLFFDPGLEIDPNASPYERLSQLCTILVIAEESSFLPLPDICKTIMSIMKPCKDNGDVIVMAARALALLLDKFAAELRLLNKSSTVPVVECFRQLFVMKSEDRRRLRFEHTNPAELTEELLKCLTLGSSAGRAVQAIMPPASSQLDFCQGSLDGSKWTSCKVLRHCTLLARAGALNTHDSQKQVEELLRTHLSALAQHDLDFEWDELLRTVTEGIITLAVWCRGGTGTDREAEKATSKKRSDIAGTSALLAARNPTVTSGSRKCKSGCSVEAQSSPTTPSESIEELFVAVCEHGCAREVAESRKELVLACAAAVVDAHGAMMRVSASAKLRMLNLLQALLETTSQLETRFSDPFALQKKQQLQQQRAHGGRARAATGGSGAGATAFSSAPAATAVTAMDDSFRELPNLQWIVPTMQWSALVLLSKFLGADPALQHDYLWAWRGTGEAYFWYLKRERNALTAAFMQAQKQVKLKRGSHVVNFIGFTDFHVLTQSVERIHFQPIPYESVYANQPFGSIAFSRTEWWAHTMKEEARSAERSARVEALRTTLRTIAFGSTPVARLAKMVYLHVVCSGAPDGSEDVKAAFRNLVGELPGLLFESLAEHLIEADPAWAPVLLDAGVADAITTVSSAPPNLKRARAEAVMTSCTVSPLRGILPSPHQQPHRSPLAGHRRSPIAQRIREATLGSFSMTSASPSGVQQAVLAPLTLPDSAANLTQFLQQATFGALIDFFDLPPTRDGFASEVEASRKALETEDSAAYARVVAALTTYVLRALQELSIEGRRALLLERVTELGTSFVSVCRPHGPAGGEARSPSSPRQEEMSRCPNGHPLHVHFSTNWACNLCQRRTAYGSLACRVCDYDLCSNCAEAALRRVEVSCTASVGDLLRGWRVRVAREAGRTDADAKKETTASGSSVKDQAETLLYTPGRVLPAVLPARCLEGGEVHYGREYGLCRCDLKCPSPTLTPITRRDGVNESEEAGAWGTTEPGGCCVLLRAFGAGVALDAGVRHALFEAVESHGTALFLHGAAGLPSRLRWIVSALSAYLPLHTKADICHFIAADCRRFALNHIQNSGLPLRGSVLGDVNSAGIAFKVSVKRDDMAESVTKLHSAFHALPSTRTKVEFSFEGEEGIGNGPTQEVYSELSRYLREAKELWYCADAEQPTLPFPTHTTLQLQPFFVFGAACARAFIDGYAMAVDLHPRTWELLRCTSSLTLPENGCGDQVLWALLEELEPVMTGSLKSILAMSSNDELDALCLDGENGCSVTLDTRDAYVRQQVRAHFEMSMENIRALRLGFATALDLDSLWMLTPAELTTLVCGADASSEDDADNAAPLFTEKELRAVVLEAHGYSTGSKEVEMLASIVGGEFNRLQQRHFIEFLTGSARMPMNGLSGLGRKITVVRKDMEGNKEQTLPSCNTCFLYLKLPPYSKREIMKERLLLAITEGRKNFSLS